MRKITSILLLITTLLSCSDDNSYTTIHTVQQFYILNKNGYNLLNPETENAIDTSNIKIYYLINGSKVEHSKYLASLNSDVSYDNTKGFYIVKPEEDIRNKYFLGLYLNIEANKENIAYTFIEWDKDHIDTIKSRISKTENSIISSMIAYNDSVWDRKENDLVFTIIK